MIAGQIARLDAEGWTVLQIADALGMTRHKVRRILTELDPPITDQRAPATAPLLESTMHNADLDKRIADDLLWAVPSSGVFNADLPNRKASK